MVEFQILVTFADNLCRLKHPMATQTSNSKTCLWQLSADRARILEQARDFSPAH